MKKPKKDITEQFLGTLQPRGKKVNQGYQLYPHTQNNLRRLAAVKGVSCNEVLEHLINNAAKTLLK